MRRPFARASEPLIRMGTNTGWLFMRSGLRMLIGLVTAVWLTRYLGPSDFGLYSYVIAFVMIFAGVSTVGMNSLVTRELVEQPNDRHAILGSALAIRVVGSLLAAVVLLIMAFALHSDSDYRVALIVFGVVLLVQPLEIVTLHYEARTESRYVVWVQLVAALLYLGVVAIMIARDLSVVWFLGARLGEVILTNLAVLAVFAAQGQQPTRWRPEAVRVRRFLAEAWPLIISALGATLYLRIDQVMLGRLTTEAEVGLYAAAARISEVWYFIPGLIVASAFPYLLRLRSEEPGSYRRRLQQLYDLLFWMGLIIAALITLLSPWLINLLYGTDYADSSPILRIHVWAGVFIFTRAAFSKWLIAERLMVYSIVTQGAGALVNIGVNLFVIPRWGGVGAAWATVISYGVASYGALVLFRRTRPAAAMITKTISAPVRALRVSKGVSHDD